MWRSILLQQYLPFMVLKPPLCYELVVQEIVATVLTVYGIETGLVSRTPLTPVTVATVLIVHGIETLRAKFNAKVEMTVVATVLTVYGIETYPISILS